MVVWFLAALALGAVVSLYFQALKSRAMDWDPSESLTECSDSPNCHKSSLVLGMDRQELLKNIVDTIEETPRMTLVNKDRHLIHSIAVSSILGFVDDVSFTLEATPKGTRLTVKSASRVGYSDLGVNAKRVDMMIEEIKNEPH